MKVGEKAGTMRFIVV